MLNTYVFVIFSNWGLMQIIQADKSNEYQQIPLEPFLYHL